MNSLAVLTAHLMELMPCDTGSSLDKSWTGTCRSYAGTVELQRMAVVMGLSQTLLMLLFHNHDCANGLCFEQGWQSMAR